MARGRVIAALAVNADDSSKMAAREPLDRMPLPTLDERANFYLRAVHGDRRFTSEEYANARALMLQAMADDIAARSNGRSADEASLLLGEQHNGLAAFSDASLLLGASEQPAGDGRSPDEALLPLGEQHDGLPAFADASLLPGASEQPAGDVRKAAPIVARKPRASLWRLPSFAAFPRMAAIGAAAAVAAVAGYWVAGITARFAPNTAPHNSSLAVRVSPPDPASGSSTSSRMVAQVEREVASALNSAQLAPDDIAAFLKRGQELAAEGKFRLARPVLERAAEAKSASAALALARTYDPLADRTTVSGDAPPDLAMARAWYEKAKDLGSPEAAQRLTQLPASIPAARPGPK